MGQRGRVARLILYVLVFIFLLVFISRMESIFGYTIQFGNVKIYTTTIMGSLTILQIIMCFAITMNNCYYGRFIAYFLLTVSLISCGFAVTVKKNIDSLPGMLMDVTGLIFVAVLSSRLRIIDKNNKLHEHNSITDSLTGIYNRRGMRRELQSRIDKGKPFYLLFLDLDNFKFINDTIGHSTGDYILKTVADRALSMENYGGFVARNGGDEFIMLIPDDGHHDIEKIAKDFLGKVSERIWIEEIEKQQHVYASIGIARFPSDGRNMDEILNFADTAMYEAKRAGKNKVAVFNKDMLDRYLHDKQMEETVRKALREGRFYLKYQPQFNSTSRTLRGFESLIRFEDENGKRINPSEFIPVAEQTDLIIDIDKYVLGLAMNQFKETAFSRDKNFLVSVNISAKHISDGGFVEDVTAILEETGYPAECLEIEITEYCMMRDLDRATDTIIRLHNLGIQIALDDFGTGYASLSNLIKLPINLLKIDKSFIDNLGLSQTNDDFVEAIISMGHLLHCDIISEGVETQEQLGILCDRGCDYIQGYIWGRPMVYEQALEIVRESV